MHPRTTNNPTQTIDVCRFSFESAGALAFDNEYSGFAVLPAHYIAFAERKHARPWWLIYHFGRYDVKPRATQPFTAYVGIDWADTKHDICLQAAGDDRANSIALPTRWPGLMNGRSRCTSASAAPSRLPWNWPRAPSSTHCRSTTSSCSFPSTQRPWPSIGSLQAQSGQGRPHRRRTCPGSSAASPRAVRTAPTAKCSHARLAQLDRTSS